jgi:hypothetical protein|tara:strand:+ start:157 stop:366 length:210 start_codon:yes stop_codon:yes gene_type:complete
MKFLLLPAAIFLGACNTQYMEFQRTVEAQLALGYKWKEIHCRQVTEDLPAITIDTPTGKKLVCNKLEKD